MRSTPPSCCNAGARLLYRASVLYSCCGGYSAAESCGDIHAGSHVCILKKTGKKTAIDHAIDEIVVKI